MWHNAAKGQNYNLEKTLQTQMMNLLKIECFMPIIAIVKYRGYELGRRIALLLKAKATLES